MSLMPTHSYHNNAAKKKGQPGHSQTTLPLISRVINPAQEQYVIVVKVYQNRNKKSTKL